MIESISDGTTTRTFSYTPTGQLAQETGPQGTISYEYDASGSLIRKTVGNAVYDYVMDGADRLTEIKVAVNGQVATKSLTWEGTNVSNDGYWTYTWELGRRLKEMRGPNGYPRVTFKYDFNGLRTEKVYQESATSQPQVTKYHYLGSKLTYVEDGSNRIYITYSPGGTPLLVTINGTTYFYLVNAQGDVLGLVDGDGNLVVEYEYDSWGKPLQAATGLAKLNPLRYRSYVHDDETSLYYLQSRYYQPEWGRFINADEILTEDLYEYCDGNPVNYVDPDGHALETVTDILSLAHSTNEFIKDPSLSNGFFLAWDGLAVAMPVVPGSWSVKSIKLVRKLAVSKNSIKLIIDVIVAVHKIDSNKINHILAKKHSWHKIVKAPNNWNEIKKLIIKVMIEGEERPYKSVVKKSLNINGEIVEVIYIKDKDGTIRISNAWVKTK